MASLFSSSSEENQLKRRRTDSEETIKSFQKFFVIDNVNADKPLSKISPFAIQKGIEGVIANPKSVKMLRNGCILIEVNKPSHANNIVKLKDIAGVPVRVSAHRTLNSSKGVIRCPDIKGCSDDEILEGLTSQHVTSIYRVMVNRDGERRPSGTFFLTFDTPSLPKKVKIGFLQVRVDPYVPNPIRCFKCQRYGHFKLNCREEHTKAKSDQ